MEEHIHGGGGGLAALLNTWYVTRVSTFNIAFKLHHNPRTQEMDSEPRNHLSV